MCKESHCPLFTRRKLKKRSKTLNLLLCCAGLIACQAEADTDSSSSNLERAEEINDWPDFFRLSFSQCLQKARQKSDDSKESCSGDYAGFREELLTISSDERIIPAAQVSVASNKAGAEPSTVFFYVDGGPLHSFPRLPDAERLYTDLRADELVVYPITDFETTGNGRNKKTRIIPFCVIIALRKTSG